MRHILEFNEYEDKKDDMKQYQIVKWQHGVNDSEQDDFKHDSEESDDDFEESDINDEMDFFDVWIKDESGKEHKIAVNYQIFIEFLQMEMPNLKSYLSNADFSNIDEMLIDLEELGIDIESILQKWVDENVNDETINAGTEEEGEGMFADEEGNIHSDYNEEDFDDLDNDFDENLDEE